MNPIVVAVVLFIIVGTAFFFNTSKMESFQMQLEQKRECAAPIDMSNCNTSCCPSTFSCSNGCVCLPDEEKKKIRTRGGNNVNDKEYS
tara:strand:- start:1371 stop:1634 length:264 start_codon:yes stop_codon:yes gene_type:complete